MDLLRKFSGPLVPTNMEPALFSSIAFCFILVILVNQVLYPSSKSSPFPTINGRGFLELNDRRILTDFVMNAQGLMQRGLSVSRVFSSILDQSRYHYWLD
jgi:hypothetical protein